MCRLLGVVAASPAPIDRLVPDELARLEALSEVHPHGWGVASVTHRGLDACREPERAGTSATWRDVVRGTRTDAATLHIRQASPGMPHVTANTHPFVADGMAFAHNGHAHPVATLDALVAAAAAPGPSGDTDSERYFSLVRAAVPGSTTDQAVLEAASRITGAATATSLNALVLTERSLVAIAWWDEPVIRGAGDGETVRDYRLWYRVAADRVVVASAFVADAAPEWRELPHGHALTVDRGTLSLRIVSVDELRPAA